MVQRRKVLGCVGAILSILIPTMPRRRHFLDRLMRVLRPQISESVHLLLDESPALDDGGPPIGAKRNQLVARVDTPYFMFVDDDDLLHPEAVRLITDALRYEPDVVGFRGAMTVMYPHRPPSDLRGNHFYHSIQYSEWREDRGVYFRPPNHLNPVRTEIGRRVPFMPIPFGEDRRYSDALRPLLKTEVYVDECIYLYEYRPHKTI